MIRYFMKNNVCLRSADRYSPVTKCEVGYIKVTIGMFIEQRNLRSLALHFSKALQEPCRNSSLLIGINGMGCTQMYRYVFQGSDMLHDTHN